MKLQCDSPELAVTLYTTRANSLTQVQVQEDVRIFPKQVSTKSSIVARGANSPVGSWALNAQGEGHSQL